MHPWGKWGRNFVEYGIAAANDALADAGLQWSDIQYVSGADTMRNGYPGYVAGATFAQALGWTGARVSSCYAACASGATALNIARAQILAGLCDVALVVGADTTPKGFLAPNKGERQADPDWLRFRLIGATNPTYFALYARRRMALYGATQEDFAKVKVKNARHGLANPYARFRKEVTVADVLESPVVADPLHLLDICATSDGGAPMASSSTARCENAATEAASVAALARHPSATPAGASRGSPSPPSPSSTQASARGEPSGSGVRARPRLRSARPREKPPLVASPMISEATGETTATTIVHHPHVGSTRLRTSRTIVATRATRASAQPASHSVSPVSRLTAPAAHAPNATNGISASPSSTRSVTGRAVTRRASGGVGRNRDMGRSIGPARAPHARTRG
ncbi:MAG: hypothetical protein KDK70_00215 [Myxococcales bacterium]|nr:hypothetical protein [Myxococcales bacterium]